MSAVWPALCFVSFAEVHSLGIGYGVGFDVGQNGVGQNVVDVDEIGRLRHLQLPWRSYLRSIPESNPVKLGKTWGNPVRVSQNQSNQAKTHGNSFQVNKTQ